MICRPALDIIRQEEGLRLRAYQDSAGVWTIGYGHTGGVSPGDEVTEVGAEGLLVADLARFEEAVRGLVKVPVTRYQFGALVSFAYNVGAGNLKRSTLLRLLNAGDHEGAAMEFRKWRKAGGKVLPGLLTRRGREEQLFRLGIPANPPQTCA